MNISFYTVKEILRFVVVGTIAVAIQYLIYWLLLEFLKHNVAYIIGYLTSFVVNYLLTTRFTFKVSITHRNAIGFIGCHIINFTLQLVLLNLFIYIRIDEELAPIPVFAVCVPTNYLLVRLVMKRSYINKL